MEFNDKTAVITAGAGGIGRACAMALAREGMNVVIADIDDAAAAKTATELEGLGRKALAVHCDVSSDEDMDDLVARTVEEFGGVDLLHNHAGIGVAGPADQIPLAEWKAVLDLNILSMVRGTVAFLEHLRASSGHIVNTTSSLGVVSGHPIGPMAIPYITSKKAIVGLTQCFATWLRPEGIGVSLLAPDHTATNFDNTVKFYGVPVSEGEDGAEEIEKVVEQTQQPEEIAEAYVEGLREDRFLLSSTPEIANKLKSEAVGMLDPAALADIYS